MIQLFINDTEIALDDNFSFKQIDENPAITSVGEFTLDMEISLEMGMNVKAFGIINRINNQFIPKEWPAMMILNNKVSRGRAIYISNTNTTVTVQYVSGNSELNYFANQEKKIWEMDWGIETEIDLNRAKQSVQQAGYQSDGFHFVCAPVRFAGNIVNNFTLKNETDILIPSTAFPIENIDGPIVMMPYLMHYVEKLPELLGFTIHTNVLLSNVKAKSMYILNNAVTLSYASALPDITLGEFIEIIEDTFNVIFIIDKTDLTLDIVYRHQYIAERPVIDLENVLDTYTRTHTEEMNERLNKFNINRITYDLPDELYYKFHRFESYWETKVLVRFENIFADILSFLTDNPDWFYNRNGYLRDSNDISYLYCDKPSQEMFNRRISDSRSVYLFNKFKDVNRGSWGVELKLKTIPAEIEKNTIRVGWNPNPQPKEIQFHYQLPTSKREFVYSDMFLYFGKPVAEMIEEGAPSISRSTVMETSLFMGLIKMFITSAAVTVDFSTYYPFSCNDIYPDFGIDPANSEVYRFENWAISYFRNNAPEGYRLNSLMDSYAQNKSFDSSKEYVMEIKENPMLSTSFLFRINNAIYIPVRFERDVSKKNELVRGYFYKML